LFSALILRGDYRDIKFSSGGGACVVQRTLPRKKPNAIGLMIHFFRNNGIRLFDSPPDAEGLPRLYSSYRQNMWSNLPQRPLLWNVIKVNVAINCIKVCIAIPGISRCVKSHGSCLFAIVNFYPQILLKSPNNIYLIVYTETINDFVHKCIQSVIASFNVNKNK
jgi:hypothetical protein